jgi:hypothetical protein
VWKAPDLALATGVALRLTDDGRALVAVDVPGTSADAPLVRVVRDGKVVASLARKDLALPSDSASWLAPDVPEPALARGRRSGAARPARARRRRPLDRSRDRRGAPAAGGVPGRVR